MSILKKNATILVLLLTFLLFSPHIGETALAQAQVCKDKSPVSAPTLVSAVAKGNSVTLTWVEGWGPITNYLLAYGLTETTIEYGSPNIGGQGTTSYTVGDLQTGVKYYFKVRPVNGCKPGKFSNKLSATIGSNSVGTVTNKPKLSIYKSVLGTSATASPAAEPTETPTPTTTVNTENTKCESCISWPLIIAEIALLTTYFIFVKKFPALKYVYSVAIPVVIFLLFWKVNQGCSLKGFSCKYFLPLDVIIFMVFVTIYKNRFLNRKTNLPKKASKKITNK